MAELEGQLRGKDAEIAGLREELKARDEAIAAKNAELTAIKNSASFKIGRTVTGPVRKLRH